MDRTSWKPKIYKTDETVDYKATEADQSEVNDYLDILRESGVTNMFGAGSYIEEEFGVDGQEARKLLQNWMENFGKSNEGDPDFDNDPDFEGKINGVSVEPSQYTQSGMDHTDYSRGDIDTESKANEDDHKKSWDKLDSIAKMGFSDIGYDQKSWDSEPEEIRAEMEKVVKDNMSQENWKEVANKIYKEELNKGKKNGGESKGGFTLSWDQDLTPYLQASDLDLDTISNQLKHMAFLNITNYHNQMIPYDNGTMVWNLFDQDKTMSFGVSFKEEGWSHGSGRKRYAEKLKEGIGANAGSFNIKEESSESKADDIRNAIAQDHEQWRKKQEPEQARQFLNNYQIPLSNKQSDYYPYDWGNQNSFSEDGFALSDTLAKNQGQSWQEGGEADPCWKGYKQIGMKDKNGKQVPNCVPESNESVLEKVHVDGWEFSVIDDGYGGGSFGSTPNAGLLEVGIFAPKSGSKTMIGDSAIKGWLTPEEVDDLKRTFEVDPVMAYRRIGGDWEEDWQKGLESNANESYLVEWGYDLDYDFAEIDNLEDAKQKAIDKGGNVYLDNTLVYSVIPSKKIDPANDKSSFITANHLMNVESKANEYDCESCGGEYSKCPHCGHAMHDYEWEDSNDVCDSCEKGKYDESYSREGHRHRWVKEDETDFCLDCDEMRPTEYEMGAKGYDHGESKANEDFADDIIELNTECWACQTSIPIGKKYCETHCGHPKDEFDSFTGQCKSCGKSLNVNMMMAMAESKEGLIDDIEKELLKFGINLDKDPNQIKEVKAKANEEGVNDWWDRVTTDGGDLDMQFRGTHFNELPLHQQNHYFNLYMEELGNDKYGNHMALYDTRPDSYSSSDLWKDDPSLGNKDQYYTGWKINEPTVDSFDRLEISGLNGSTRDNDMMKFLVKTTESKASEADLEGYLVFEKWQDEDYVKHNPPFDLENDWLNYADRHGVSFMTASIIWLSEFLAKASEVKSEKSANALLDKMDHDNNAYNIAQFLSNLYSPIRSDIDFERHDVEDAFGLSVREFANNGHISLDQAIDGIFKFAEINGYSEEYIEEEKASEGFNQGLYGYVDAKCKTCGIEFDSIPDMDDHYAMNSDHISNLNDLDSDIPNSD